MTNTVIPWEKICRFLLCLAGAKDMNRFCEHILSGLRDLCPFDQALIYRLDGNRKVCGRHLEGFEEYWSDFYLKCFFEAADKRYALSRDIRESEGRASIARTVWEQEPADAFLRDYIRPRGLKYSLAFLLFDTQGMPKTFVSMDRIRNTPFSDSEYQTILLLLPLLSALHKALPGAACDTPDAMDLRTQSAGLTTRETEIAHLLCRGVSPANISRHLCISRSTTYSHIAHIYEKMEVSSRQELLVRLLG